jgi:hypothetical protein
VDPQPWVVKNGANGDEPMVRCSTMVGAIVFMELFCERTVNATVDDRSIALWRDGAVASRAALAPVVRLSDRKNPA